MIKIVVIYLLKYINSMPSEANIKHIQNKLCSEIWKKEWGYTPEKQFYFIKVKFTWILIILPCYLKKLT